MNIETLNLKETREALHIALATRANLCIEGDPGIGKTALVTDVVSTLNPSEFFGYHGNAVGAPTPIPFRTLIGSAMAPEDLSIPAKNEVTKRIERWILGPIADLVQASGGVLFLDEITDVPRSVWAPLQRLVNEREVGDTKLPDNVAIVMACNSAQVATGGQDLSWPVVGRISFVRCVPEVSEVAEVFLSKLAPKASGHLASLLADFGASLDLMPKLLQCSPPEGATEASPWGAPRSWERGLKLMAGALDRGADANSKIVNALLTGSVGRDIAGAYLTLHSVRASLPSVKEICADPTNAKLPSRAAFAACAGIIGQVGILDAHAGWTYTQRLTDEARLIAGRILTRCPRGKDTSAHKVAGTKARIIVEAEIGKAQRMVA